MTEPVVVFEFEGGRAAFTTREAPGGGRGPGAAALLAETLAAPSVARLQQVHGARVVIVSEGSGGAAVDGEESTFFLGDGDALVTGRRDVALAVVTADCVPVLIVDRHARGVAAIHAGWRGIVAGVVPRVVEALGRSLGIPPADLDALVGPSAGGCCYEVGREVVDALREVAGESGEESDWVRPGRAERPHVEIREVVRRQLRLSGLGPEAIRTHVDCTICRSDVWPSYRREAAGAGRIWAGVALGSGLRA